RFSRKSRAAVSGLFPPQPRLKYFVQHPAPNLLVQTSGAGRENLLVPLIQRPEYACAKNATGIPDRTRRRSSRGDTRLFCRTTSGLRSRIARAANRPRSTAIAVRATGGPGP